ncbi:HIT family protein [Nakamurella sp. PAMC28650]|jgi:histidine triad (HIT) family protein|uniref:HIT family protein n=1 Tax=Nakamurella sp. PAMC28650 TaxID=2762325 RepID=UPI00164D9D21|nr:HIT family protein [Nakamurella sp. PAMC28650]QNK80220.1 HIT family protein [Nakamurella sp. PAMC28650]
MPTLFSRIIDRELPGRFVHEDDLAVAFLTIAPIRPGHTLVVPRAEIDQWTDADPELLAHCTRVAQQIGRAVKSAFGAPRAALIIAGFEVEHLHLHVYPVWGLSDFDLQQADPATASDLDDAAARIRAAL